MGDSSNQMSNQEGASGRSVRTTESSSSSEIVCSSTSGSKRNHDSDGKSQSEDSTDCAKRPRGPYDCLNWDDDSDEEFTPFTQSNPEGVPPTPPKKVFAVKSSAKSSSKSSVKRSSKSSVNAGAKKSSKAKGKSGIFLH
jgi:hypothetical protein